MTKPGIFNPFRKPLPDGPGIQPHMEDSDDAPIPTGQTRLDGDTHVLVLDNIPDIPAIRIRLGEIFKTLQSNPSYTAELARWGVSFGASLRIPQAALETPAGTLHVRYTDSGDAKLNEIEIYRNICIALNALPVHALLTKHGAKVVVRRN